MLQFEQELEQLQHISGVDEETHPLKWIKWETQFKSITGTRAPIWREPAGDIGYVIAATHDNGIQVIMCKKDGKCCPIKGYVFGKSGTEVLDYTPLDTDSVNLKAALCRISPIFSATIAQALENPPADETEEMEAILNTLVSLPQPVLVIPPQTDGEQESEEGTVVVDDEPIIPFPHQLPSDNEYWNIKKPMKDFVSNSTDPHDQTLQEIAVNPSLKESIGQRAILDAGALPSIIDVLKGKRGKQIVAAVQILAQISLSSSIRLAIANDDSVKIILDLVEKEEKSIMNPLLTIVANCCHNTRFRDLVVKYNGVEPLIYQLGKKTEFSSQICYVLWTLNRSQNVTQAMLKSHALSVLERYVSSSYDKYGDKLMINLTRLLHSIATYSQFTANQPTLNQLQFFCAGLGSAKQKLVMWAAKALSVFRITEDLQKPFLVAEGPIKLGKTIDSKETDVILAGLEAIAVISASSKIAEVIVNSCGILPKLQLLWKHDNIDVRKYTLRAVGVLTRQVTCAKWTVRQNIVPDLIEYLHSTDPDFVIYSARAIGACCSQQENMSRLIDQSGMRLLWSLMKSSVSSVQAAVTRALVPFLKTDASPAIIRTFVDGLDLLVDLLKSSDPDVQAAACLAITEVSRDKENLGVMTDLGLVELLSRVLPTPLDFVRRPLAEAISVVAPWRNNRRRFGEEGAVDLLVAYLRPPSTNKDVHAATARAMRELSEDTENAIALRQAGVVDYLLIMVQSSDRDLQMAAAVAIRNIRMNSVLS